MQKLEKILEEIDKIYVDDIGVGVDCNLQGRSDLPCDNCYECIKDACKDIIRKHMTDGWIPVEHELPENAKHEGAFCPKYRVLTKYGETIGWYNPNSGGWYVLFWFMTGRLLETEIDFIKGDIPKVLFFKKKDFLLAWKPFEPYRPEKGAKIC